MNIVGNFNKLLFCFICFSFLFSGWSIHSYKSNQLTFAYIIKSAKWKGKKGAEIIGFCLRLCHNFIWLKELLSVLRYFDTLTVLRSFGESVERNNKRNKERFLKPKEQRAIEMVCWVSAWRIGYNVIFFVEYVCVYDGIWNISDLYSWLSIVVPYSTQIQ